MKGHKRLDSAPRFCQGVSIDFLPLQRSLGDGGRVLERYLYRSGRTSLHRPLSPAHPSFSHFRFESRDNGARTTPSWAQEGGSVGIAIDGVRKRPRWFRITWIPPQQSRVGASTFQNRSMHPAKIGALLETLQYISSYIMFRETRLVTTSRLKDDLTPTDFRHGFIVEPRRLRSRISQ